MLKRPASPADLPASLPLFPLSGALLLPYARRPLNIFEPRYLEMIDHALRGDRLIGLIQPQDTTEESPQGAVPLQRIGTVGRLTHFEEVEEARYFVILEGICRFELIKEMPVMTPFRRGMIATAAFASDFDREFGEEAVDRLALPQDDARLCRVRQFRPQLGRDREDGHGGPRQFLLHGLALRGGGEAGAARGQFARGAGRDADRHGRVRDGEGRQPDLAAQLTKARQQAAPEPRHGVDPRTLEMLVCPLTKTRLTLSDDGQELISVAAHLAFPIRDGVPMLSLDEAREIDPEEMNRTLPRLAGDKG